MLSFLISLQFIRITTCKVHSICTDEDSGDSSGFGTSHAHNAVRGMQHISDTHFTVSFLVIFENTS